MPDRYVKPADNRRVRVPSHGFAVMPPEGQALPDDVFLRRRLRDADVVECDPPSAADADPATALGTVPPAAVPDASLESDPAVPAA